MVEIGFGAGGIPASGASIENSKLVRRVVDLRE
jgi:hypothetical protein